MNSRVAAVVLAGLSVLSTEAVGADDPKGLLDQGINQFNLGQFRRAERTLLQALHRARVPTRVASIQLYLGQLYVVQGRTSKAEIAFREALTHNPLLRLDPGQTKTTILEVFNRSRAGLTGELAVTASQEGAQLALDGASAGPLPYKAKVPIGEHGVVVTLPDGLYDDFKTKVVVYAGKTHIVHAKLRAHSGKVKLTSQPSGARVFLGKTELGTTPIEEVVLPTGEHRIHFRLKGHRSHTEVIRVAGGVTSTVSVRLAAVPAAVERPRLTEAPRRRTSGARLAAWITGGAALAAAGVGVGMGFWTRRTFQELEEAGESGDVQRYQDLKDTGPRQQLVTNVFWATAGALAVTATLLYFLGDRPEPNVAVKPGGPGMLSVEF
jgi:hypothetical protein